MPCMNNELDKMLVDIELMSKESQETMAEAKQEIKEIQELLDGMNKDLRASELRYIEMHTTKDWVMDYLTITSIGVVMFTLFFFLLGLL